jgi:hypothetical protein
MKNNKTIYRLITGVICAFMLFSAWYSGTHKIEFTQRLGFPDYFRIELTAAKIIGVIVLLIPKVSDRVREWVYVGFSICLISAFIAKINSGYPVSGVVEPISVFIIMMVLLWYLNKLNKAPVASNN